MTELDDKTLISYGLEVLEIEASSINNLASNLGNSFIMACRALLSCEGRIIVTGMGKSGHIAKKIAATLASTGTPSFFMHPAEASHGDLGMVTSKDLVLALSNSGETDEIVVLVPLLKRLGIKLIAMVGKQTSTLSKLADIFINVSVEKEACSLGLAPTSSTTAALAMGDALAVSVLQARGFTSDDFAMSHPGGKLGRRLLIKISDIMHQGEKLPKVFADTTLPDAIVEMTNKCLGMTTVVDKNDTNKIIGLFTDGDLRRTFTQNTDLHSTLISDVMITKFKTIKGEVLAAEALSIMESHKINALPVVDDDNNIIGAFNMHDLFKAGVV